MSKDIGVAVIGSGRIGTIRARVCSQLLTVNKLVVTDLIPEKAKKLAEVCNGAKWSTDSMATIENDDVDAVIVSTDEKSHFEPTRLALKLGKPTLVEKPLVLTLKEADLLLETALKYKAPLMVGYTQRLRRKFSSVKETIDSGYLGNLTSLFGRIDITRAVARAVADRSPDTTPALNTLTYQIDLALWYMKRKPARVYAQASGDTLGKKKDSTWSIVTFRDGTVAAFGVNWNIPEAHPASVASMDLQLVGSKGTLFVSDRHEDFLLVTNEPFHSPYNPEVSVNVAYLGSAMPGDWSLSRFFGPMKYETELFVENVLTRRPVPIATGQDARNVLELGLAMDLSLTKDKVVNLPLA